MDLRSKLIHAATEYDRKQSTRRGYNPHALGIYFQRIDEVCADIAKGAPVRAALCAGFNDRLLDHMLKAAGQAPGTREEIQGGAMVYQPVKE